MNTFILILQIIAAIIGIFFLIKSWNKETQTYEKESLKGVISCAVFFIVLNYFKSSDIQINNIQEANNLLLNKSKTEIVELLGKPDWEYNIGGENYYVYDSSKRGSFYQLDAAGNGKELRVYFDEDNNCYVIGID